MREHTKKDREGVGPESRKRVQNSGNLFESSRVREFLTSKGWEFHGKDEEMEMDSYRNKKTGQNVFVEDISEAFPSYLSYGRA